MLTGFPLSGGASNKCGVWKTSYTGKVSTVNFMFNNVIILYSKKRCADHVTVAVSQKNGVTIEQCAMTSRLTSLHIHTHSPDIQNL